MLITSMVQKKDLLVHPVCYKYIHWWKYPAGKAAPMFQVDDPSSGLGLRPETLTLFLFPWVPPDQTSWLFPAVTVVVLRLAASAGLWFPHRSFLLVEQSIPNSSPIPNSPAFPMSCKLFSLKCWSSSFLWAHNDLYSEGFSDLNYLLVK